MFKDEIRGAFYIVLKDLKTYYFKPPNLSWGIMFPIVMALAFVLRNPTGITELAPGLIAMSSLFASTSAEAIVIVFEKRTKTFERLLLAPLSINSVLLGKTAGGAIFGFLMSAIFLISSVIFLKTQITDFISLTLILVLSATVFSALSTFVSIYVKEVFDAMTLANFFRFPMIFLCGVFVPVSALPPFLQPLSYVLPLTYSVDLIRFFLTGTFDIVNPLISIVILLGYSIILFQISVYTLKRRMEQ
jgi:ABC-2 type transport system permease protein